MASTILSPALGTAEESGIGGQKTSERWNGSVAVVAAKTVGAGVH